MEFTEEMFCSTTTGEIGDTGDTEDAETAEVEVVTAFNMLVKEAI